MESLQNHIAKYVTVVHQKSFLKFGSQQIHCSRVVISDQNIIYSARGRDPFFLTEDLYIVNKLFFRVIESY